MSPSLSHVSRFVLSAVSPAVVVPSMLLLQKDGYGVQKGIPTLLMAAGSFDDVLAITGFTTCLGVAFASGNTHLHTHLHAHTHLHTHSYTPTQTHTVATAALLTLLSWLLSPPAGSAWYNMGHGVLEVLGGSAAGAVLGVFLQLFPSKDQVWVCTV